STLLNLLAGIDRPTNGDVEVMGTQLTRMTESQLATWRNAHIGYIFQTFNLVPVLTAFENVELPLLLTKLSRAERKKNVETALELVGLSDRMHHQPKQLSGGQEQRVAIARAIVTDPDLILADEPTGNLDARSGEEVMQILSTLNHELKKTIMLVTHDPHAASFASEQMHLEKGVLTELEPVASRQAPGGQANLSSFAVRNKKRDRLEAQPRSRALNRSLQTCPYAARGRMPLVRSLNLVLF